MTECKSMSEPTPNNPDVDSLESMSLKSVESDPFKSHTPVPTKSQVTKRFWSLDASTKSRESSPYRFRESFPTIKSHESGVLRSKESGVLKSRESGVLKSRGSTPLKPSPYGSAPLRPGDSYPLEAIHSQLSPSLTDHDSGLMLNKHFDVIIGYSSLNVTEDIVRKPSATETNILNTFSEMKKKIQLTIGYMQSSILEPDKTERYAVAQTTTSQETVRINDILGCLKWCMDTVKQMKSFSSLKEMVSEKEDLNFHEKIRTFAEANKTNNEIAKHLAHYYVANRHQDAYIEETMHPQPPTQRRNSKFPTTMYIENPEHNQDDDFSLITVGDIEPVATDASQMINSWECDIFKLGKMFSTPLSNTMYFVMMKHDLFDAFEIPKKVLMRYMFKMEGHYRPNNPYHNQIHATDVLQTTDYLISSEPLLDFFSNIEIFALLFAAAIHDVDHPGLSNQYLIRTKSPLAVLYNDVSVLENHHAATAFKLIYEDKNNFLQDLSSDDVNLFRKLVIDGVMSTDMTLHNPTISALKLSSTKFVSGLPDPVLHLNERQDIMKGLLHFADISNPAKPLHVYRNWVNRITEEFHAQGDLERYSKLELSPMCDRFKANIGKGQVGFIDYIVKPICCVVVNLIGCVNADRGDRLNAHLQTNYDFYKNMAEETVVPTEGREFTKRAIERHRKQSHLVDLQMKRPSFFRVSKRPELHWDASGSESEEETIG